MLIYMSSKKTSEKKRNIFFLIKNQIFREIKIYKWIKYFYSFLQSYLGDEKDKCRLYVEVHVYINSINSNNWINILYKKSKLFTHNSYQWHNTFFFGL